MPHSNTNEYTKANAGGPAPTGKFLLITVPLEFPVNMNHIPGLCIIPNMADFDSFNCGIYDLWRKFLDIPIIFNGRIDFAPLHASCKSPDLLQYIGIKHIVVYPVRFRANLRMRVVIHAQIYIRRAFL